MTKEDNSIALLIDCDNISHNSIEGIINELSKYGVINIKNAYGNWKSPKLKGWEEKLHEFALQPIQQFDYTKGKNATDIAMIIDAMDILYGQKMDAFALATSDSDFTPIVMRILRNGIKVYGFGEEKTPEPFINACSQFIKTESLIEKDDEKKSNFTKRELRQDTKLVSLLRNATLRTMDEDGWSNLSKIGAYISNNSSFSPVNYGYQKLGDMIREIDLFDIEMRHNYKQMYIKDKRG
ncbi:MAG: NYN domain-containing protein [Epsilonproteobacteria bacterium]|nr:NYN domain-containing protein [Campylobacterota bacterium]